MGAGWLSNYMKRSVAFTWLVFVGVSHQQTQTLLTRPFFIYTSEFKVIIILKRVPNNLVCSCIPLCTHSSVLVC